MSLGIYAEKVGMSQFFLENGMRVPVTLFKIKTCKVVAKKNLQKHGYDSVVVGFDEVKENKLNKPQKVSLQNLGMPLFRKLREFRGEYSSLSEGQDLSANEVFNGCTFVDVTSVSKGKGFAGVMKRHGFGGLRASHGVSISHRSHGSTGNMRKQGKVFKGKKMAGHMGNTQVTVHNLKIMKIDEENGLFIVQGCAPGFTGSLSRIVPAVKKPSPVNPEVK